MKVRTFRNAVASKKPEWQLTFRAGSLSLLGVSCPAVPVVSKALRGTKAEKGLWAENRTDEHIKSTMAGGEEGMTADPSVAALSERAVASGIETEDFVCTWNTNTGERLDQINAGGTEDGVCALVINYRSRFVAGDLSGNLIVYEHVQGLKVTEAFRFTDVSAPDRNQRVSGNRHLPLAVCGERLDSASLTGDVTIWDLETRSSVAEIPHNASVFSVDMSESVVFAAAQSAPYVRVYIVADNYSCVRATGFRLGSPWFGNIGAYPWRRLRLVSVHMLGGGYVLPSSDDKTITISALHSDEVVARIRFRDELGDIAVVPDDSIMVLGLPVCDP